MESPTLTLPMVHVVSDSVSGLSSLVPRAWHGQADWAYRRVATGGTNEQGEGGEATLVGGRPPAR